MEPNQQGRTFIIADIHGAYKAFIQCLQGAGFDYENDRLICLGDVCDGWPEVKECYSELMKVKNLILLLGNHDEMALQWMLGGGLDPVWLMQGGSATLESFGYKVEEQHLEMIRKSKKYYIHNNCLYVHAGCIPGKPIKEHNTDELIWDRSLIQLVMEQEKAGNQKNLTGFESVFIGHTPTIRFGKTVPFKVCEVWMMDTGAGWNGRLSMMDLESREVFQSDHVPGLYPGHRGRF